MKSKILVLFLSVLLFSCGLSEEKKSMKPKVDPCCKHKTSIYVGGVYQKGYTDIEDFLINENPLGVNDIVVTIEDCNQQNHLGTFQLTVLD